VHPPAARDSDRSTGHLYQWRVFRPGGLLTIRLALISYGWGSVLRLILRACPFECSPKASQWRVENVAPYVG
jgi:hypothetical protein